MMLGTISIPIILSTTVLSDCSDLLSNMAEPHSVTSGGRLTTVPEGDGATAKRSKVVRGAVALSLSVLLIQACASGDVAAVANLVSEQNAKNPDVRRSESPARPATLRNRCQGSGERTIPLRFMQPPEGATSMLSDT